MFELIIEPIVVIFKADQNCGGPPMARHHDFLTRRKLNVTG